MAYSQQPPARFRGRDTLDNLQLEDHHSNVTIAPQPQIRLPPVRQLIAEIDAHRCSVRISKSVSTPSRQPAVCCQSVITHGIPGVPLVDFGTALPTVTLYNLADEAALHACLTSSGVRPMLVFPWDGYNHLNWRQPLTVGAEVPGTIRHLVCQVVAGCYRFARDNADKFRGPGIRLGPDHVPFESLRLQQIVQIEGTIWMALFGLYPTQRHVSARRVI